MIKEKTHKIKRKSRFFIIFYSYQDGTIDSTGNIAIKTNGEFLNKEKLIRDLSSKYIDPQVYIKSIIEINKDEYNEWTRK